MLTSAHSSNNVAVGTYAAYDLKGNNNVEIGGRTGTNIQSATRLHNNSIAIGYDATTTNDDNIQLGTGNNPTKKTVQFWDKNVYQYNNGDDNFKAKTFIGTTFTGTTFIGDLKGNADTVTTFQIKDNYPTNQKDFEIVNKYDSIQTSLIGNWYAEIDKTEGAGGGLGTYTWRCAVKYTEDGKLYVKYSFYSLRRTVMTEVSEKNPGRSFSTEENTIIMKSVATELPMGVIPYTYYDLKIQLKDENTLTVTYKVGEGDVNTYTMDLVRATSNSVWDINFDEIAPYSPDYSCNLLYKQNDKYVNLRIKESLNSLNTMNAVVDLKDDINKRLYLDYKVGEGFNDLSYGDRIYYDLGGDLILDLPPTKDFSPISYIGRTQCKIHYSVPLYLSSSKDDTVVNPSNNGPDFSTPYYIPRYYNGIYDIEFDLTYTYTTSDGTFSSTETLRCSLRNGAQASAIFHGYNGNSTVNSIIVDLRVDTGQFNDAYPRTVFFYMTRDVVKTYSGANTTENGTYRISNLRGIK